MCVLYALCASKYVPAVAWALPFPLTDPRACIVQQVRVLLAVLRCLCFESCFVCVAASCLQPVCSLNNRHTHAQSTDMNTQTHAHTHAHKTHRFSSLAASCAHTWGSHSRQRRWRSAWALRAWWCCRPPLAAPPRPRACGPPAGALALTRRAVRAVCAVLAGCASHFELLHDCLTRGSPQRAAAQIQT